MKRREFLLTAAATTAAAAPLAPDLPDTLLAEAYEKAARQNVLASVNPQVFPGYFSVCADGRGFGFGNSYPSLDGHQLTDALLWLGQVDTALANFAYVRSFQRSDGNLPLAIFPTQAGKTVGPAGFTATIDPNGGLYQHWVPGNPLAALASPTFIQNADVIFRRTLHLAWLRDQLPAINLAARFLESLLTPEGAVRGAGYYVERPTRLDCDAVTQPHAADAFLRAAALNRLAGDRAQASRLHALATRIRRYFVSNFWTRNGRFAEYRHPQRGFISRHGYTDADWAALAFGFATPAQTAQLWPRIRDEKKFEFGGMPTAIATEPENYEAWEFAYPDRMDLAAMGRVWYLECHARARLGDAAGLLASLHKVCATGRASGYFWRERYGPNGGYGAEKYCEYPANLIRIVQRFLMGVRLELDGSLTLQPIVTPEFVERGFGQQLSWRNRTLDYRIHRQRLEGTYSGPPGQLLTVRLGPQRKSIRLTLPPGPFRANL